MTIHSSTFFGSVGWYASIVREGACCLSVCDAYRRQTPRNRMQIVTANGVQTLSVPVALPNTAIGGRCPIKEAGISNHGNWRHVHWQALCSAYGMSPFFDFYADDILPFFTETCWGNLFDYDFAITQKMLELLEINIKIEVVNAPPNDFMLPATNISIPSYYQTFQQRHGFLSNMSILDLLFNEGSESILKLQ